MEWRPIDTAPKRDLEDTLVFSPIGGIEVAFWSEHQGCWVDARGGYLCDDHTHWMPLPAPPEDN